LLFLALADDECNQQGYLGRAYPQKSQKKAVYPGVHAVYSGVQPRQPVSRLPTVTSQVRY
jgi:hypothetical protein